jgi:transcriptional regulator with XRE-family HTH domain
MLQGKLGAQLRRLRMERQMSVRTLAARSGFSPSFISQVEADLVSPSIASLEKIAGQLRISLAQLFSSIEQMPRTIVPAAERVTYRSDWSHSVVEALNDAAIDRRLSAVQVTFEQGGSSGKRVSPALHDTILYLVTGAVTLTLEVEEFPLSAGDTAYLQEGDTFMIQNHAAAAAVMLLVSVATHGNIFPATGGPAAAE